MNKYVAYPSAFTLAAFGLLTLFMSASVIFDLFGIREKEGNYVLFVVWANFVCGILYLFASFGFLRNVKWRTKLLVSAVFILVAAFIGLLIHIQQGGIYETQTVRAMTFRLTFTFALTLISRLADKRPSQ
jgi:hypothetical protein